MTARRYTDLIRCFVAVLLFSAAAPCGLLEAAGASVCTAESAPATSAEGDGHAGDLPLDCCSACLTCCASCTATPMRRPLVPEDAAASCVASLEQRPVGSPLSIWRPPRV